VSVIFAPELKLLEFGMRLQALHLAKQKILHIWMGETGVAAT